MRKIYLLIFAAAAMLAVACKNKKVEIQPVRGTLDGPVNEERAPQKVHLAMTLDYTDRFENILDDQENGVSVWSLVWCNPDISSEGYGIHVTKGGKTTHFPNIYHGKNPRAVYDANTGLLWLFCGVMEGTGIHVEKPYLFRFDETGSAVTETKIDPYTIQEALCNRLSFIKKGNELSFFDNGESLCTVTNTITDMGGLDEEQPVWIGEQISYCIEGGSLYVHFTPGAKYTTGLVLMCDDMPELSAEVSFAGNGALSLGAIQVLP